MKKVQTIILTGKSGSGKTTVGRILEEKYGLKKIVTYTTRPMREGEVDGVDYHFVSTEVFLEMKHAGLFAETADYNASFGHCWYGSLKADYTGGGKYVILNPIGFRAVAKTLPGSFSAYLHVPESELKVRLKKRGDKKAEITRRLAADRKDFEGIDDEVTYVFDTNTPEVLADNIYKLAQS